MRQNHISEQPLQALADAELLQEIRQRNADAFEELRARYALGVRAYVFREALSPGEADFLVDRVFLDIWTGASLFDAEVHGVVHAWVYAVAREACREFFRPGTHRRMSGARSTMSVHSA